MTSYFYQKEKQAWFICWKILVKTVKQMVSQLILIKQNVIFNKTGRLLRRNFVLGNQTIDTVRSYKYLGLVFTPPGGINSALEDLRSRALKAYMSLKHKIGDCFTTHIDETMKLFDTLIKPILIYSSDFWACLKFPANSPIENLDFRFHKNILGVHKSTTNVGIVMTAQKASIKNRERIRGNNANKHLISSCEGAKAHLLDRSQRITSCPEHPPKTIFTADGRISPKFLRGYSPS